MNRLGSCQAAFALSLSSGSTGTPSSFLSPGNRFSTYLPCTVFAQLPVSLFGFLWNKVVCGACLDMFGLSHLPVGDCCTIRKIVQHQVLVLMQIMYVSFHIDNVLPKHFRWQ